MINIAASPTPRLHNCNVNFHSFVSTIFFCFSCAFPNKKLSKNNRYKDDHMKFSIHVYCQHDNDNEYQYQLSTLKFNFNDTNVINDTYIRKTR